MAAARQAAGAEVSALRQSAAHDAAEAAQDREQAAQGRMAAEGHAEALRGQVARLEAIPADVDHWLDTPAGRTGQTFRNIFDRSAAERRARTARLNRLVAQHTDPEVGVSDAQFG